MRALALLLVLLPVLSSAAVPMFGMGRIGFGNQTTAAALEITTSTLAAPVVGVTWAPGALTASGCVGTCTFAQVAAAPNDELWAYVTPSGAPGGIPQAIETDSITYQVSDSANGNTAQKTFTVPVTATGSMSMVSSTTIPGTCASGGFCAFQIIVQGGYPPYVFTGGTFSQPWQLTQTGWIEGAPTTTGTVSFGTITITGADGSTVTYAPSWTVGSTLVIAGVDPVSGVIKLPPAISGNYWQYQLNAYGGSFAGTGFTATAGLPAWATETSAGLISGTPTQTGAVAITEQVTDGTNTATAIADMSIGSADVVSRPSYNSSTANGFFVLNGKLYDPNGRVFHVHGVDRAHFDSISWASGANGALSGVNAVREFSGIGGTYGRTGSLLQSQITTQYNDNGMVDIATVSDVLSTFTGSVTNGSSTLTVSAVGSPSVTSAGVMVLGSSVTVGLTCPAGTTIAAQLTGTSGSTGTYELENGGTAETGCTTASGAMSMDAGTSGNTDPNEVVGAVNQILQVATSLQAVQATGLIINIANEWGPTNSSTWATTYETAIAALRAAGFTCPLLIDTGNSGQDPADLINYASAVLASDALENTLFGFHAYGGVTNVTIPIASVTTGTTTTITLQGWGSSATHPFAAGYPTNTYTGITSWTVMGAQGMTELNGAQPSSANNVGGSEGGGWTITLNVNSTGWPAYTGGGYIAPSKYYTSEIASLAAPLRANGVDVLISEYGPGNNIGPSPTLVSRGQIISVAAANGMGELQWAWDDGNSPIQWSTFFGMTSVQTGQAKGQYLFSAPSDLSEAGQEAVVNPRYGINTLAIPATSLH